MIYPQPRLCSEPMIDLHTHSTASDGTLSPAQLARQAESIGLTAVALTDHDTTAGLAEFEQAARSLNVEAIAGVELACNWYSGSLHIVGLFIEPGNPVLEGMLETVRLNRQARNQTILEKLEAIGHPLTLDEVRAESGDGVIGRPHIAKALVSRGYCADISEAFDRLLTVGKPAYVRRFLPTCAEGIAAIHAAGGVAVWAHPVGFRQLPPGKVRQMARQLKGMALDGVEFYYSEYSPEQQMLVQNIGRELDLLASGGSDFHGDTIPTIQLGTGKGNLAVPDSILPQLRERAARIHAKISG